jgi:hypothetical protein
MWHGNDAHYKSFNPFALIGIGFNQNFVEYPKQVMTNCPKKKRHWKVKQSWEWYLCHPTLLINANGGLSLNLTVTN